MTIEIKLELCSDPENSQTAAENTTCASEEETNEYFANSKTTINVSFVNK